MVSKFLMETKDCFLEVLEVSCTLFVSFELISFSFLSLRQSLSNREMFHLQVLFYCAGFIKCRHTIKIELMVGNLNLGKRESMIVFLF